MCAAVDSSHESRSSCWCSIGIAVPPSPCSIYIYSTRTHTRSYSQPFRIPFVTSSSLVSGPESYSTFRSVRGRRRDLSTRLTNVAYTTSLQMYCTARFVAVKFKCIKLVTASTHAGRPGLSQAAVLLHVGVPQDTRRWFAPLSKCSQSRHTPAIHQIKTPSWSSCPEYLSTVLVVATAVTLQNYLRSSNILDFDFRSTVRENSLPVTRQRPA